MKLNDYKIIFAAAGLIGVLLIASPVLANLLSPHVEEHFSQLYLLGPEHQAKNYPFNVQAGQNYSVYLGVANHMGSSVYYTIYLKFRNQTDSLPNDHLAAPSSLTPLYEYKFAIPNGNTWENLLTFSVSDVSISGNQSLVSSLSLNGLSFNVNKPSVWNANATIFYYQLFFELWAYNSQSGSVEYNNRQVDLQLNMTNAHV
jgi:uncharacterized membrane protein